MLEARTLDDVGYTLDRHHEAKAPISMSLGKHTNDQMASFYSRSPLHRDSTSSSATAGCSSTRPPGP